MNYREQDLQRTVVEWLNLAQPRCIWFAVPNQRGTRKRYEMGILQGMGVKAGIPDLVFLWKNGSGGIELKFANGKVSKTQLEFADLCIDESVHYRIARSIEEVRDVLSDWGIQFQNDVRLT